MQTPQQNPHNGEIVPNLLSQRSSSIIAIPKRGKATVDIALFSQLMDRVRSGDQDAASELVTNYESLIRREVRLRLEDDRLRRVFDSMDVCQSVLASFFVRAAVGEFDIEDPRQLVRLLITMTKNKVASAARREQQQKRDHRKLVGNEDALGEVAHRDHTPSQIVAGKEMLERIFAMLVEEEKQIAGLRNDGYSWEEIANTMGGTAQARRVQFSRAIARVSQQMGLELDSYE